MADSKRYLDWYQKAEKDLSGAKILFEYDGDNALVAFHCQQAIEKALKGYILSHSAQLIEGHSLVFLCKKAAAIHKAYQAYLKDCAYVNQFYIETRYPSDTPTELSKDEAKECITIAETILNNTTSKE